jgi:hypothetical protein
MKLHNADSNVGANAYPLVSLGKDFRLLNQEKEKVKTFNWNNESETQNREYIEPPIPNAVLDGQPVLYKKQLIYFRSSVYLSDPKQIWKLDAIVDTARMQALLTTRPIVDADLIETLLGELTFNMFLSVDGHYLVDYDSETNKASFGPLSGISVLEAARRYGISVVEEAGEKNIVRL